VILVFRSKRVSLDLALGARENAERRGELEDEDDEIVSVGGPMIQVAPDGFGFRPQEDDD